jgi:CHAT domain-containing protein
VAAVNSRSVVAATVVALAWIAAPSRADAPRIESVIQGFYAAYAAGDAAAAESYWTTEGAKTFAARHARTFLTRCQILHALTVGPVETSGDTAMAGVEARLTRWSAMRNAAVEDDEQHAVMTLRRERGEWKIAGWRMREEDLLEDLLKEIAKAAPADAETRLRAAGDLRTPRLVRLMTHRAVTMINQGNRDGAAALLTLAHGLAESLDHASSLADVLSTESILLRGSPAGLATARAATELAGEAGDPDALARALLRLGRAQGVAGDPDEAASFERVLALADFVEDAPTIALAASQLARIYDGSNAREALRYALIASGYAEASGDPAAIASAEMNLTGTYHMRGDVELALRHAEKLLSVAERAGFKDLQADALENVAFYHLELGHRERYLDLIAKALELAPEGNAANRLDIIVSHGEYLMLWANDLPAAEARLARATPLLPRLTPKDFAWLYYMKTMALLRIHQRRFDEALQYVEQLGTDPRMGRSRAELKILILDGQGRKLEARRALETAIRGNEAYRSNIDVALHRGSFLQSTSFLYQSLIDNLVEADEWRQALSVAEQLKARVLKELIAKTWTTAADAGNATAGGNEEIARLDARIHELNRRLLAIQRDGGNPASVRAQLRTVRGQLDEAMARPGRAQQPASPASADLDLDTIALPDDTTVVEYVCAPEKTTVFTIRRGNGTTRVQAHVIAIDSFALQSQIKGLTQAMEERDATFRTRARALYDLLLKPALGSHPPRSPVCIIPDDQLWAVPFQALVSPRGEYLIERGEVFYAPSLSMIAAPSRTERRQRRPTLLAMGDPRIDRNTRDEIHVVRRDAVLGRLPDAAREVRELRRLYGARATVRVGERASEAALKREAGRYDVVHLATHGLVDVRAPMYSALLLAGSAHEDGLLEAREILGLPLHADLVVLSACDTARGRALGGEGVVGLSWAILATGCPRTIATQWRVGSASAARLMIAFHRRLAALPSVEHVARSLRAAQLEMLRSREFSHPHYWAGFILVGRDD